MKIFILLLVTSVWPTVWSRLYGSQDHVLELSSNNFSSQIYNKLDQTFIIQFYNSWCGHCISFAPIWKSLAKDIQGWKSVVRLAVLDCSDDINTKICRDFNIESYPTIRTFWFNTTEGQHGVELKGDERKIEGLKKKIIEWLESSLSTTSAIPAPSSWPRLKEVEDLETLRKSQLIVAEENKSFLGRQLILDFSSKQIVISRITDLDLLNQLTTQQLTGQQLTGQRFEANQLPVLLSVKDGEVKVFKLPYKLTIDKKDDEIRKYFHRLVKEKFIYEPPNEDVHMIDLENALRYSLFNEITLKRELNSSQLNALKNYLQVIEQHFPWQTKQGSINSGPWNSDQHSGSKNSGSKNIGARNLKSIPQLLKLIQYLIEWLSMKNHNLKMDDLIKILTQYKSQIPKLREWKSCLGSDPKYRGYPCSMWLLFHTLTVNEYLKSMEPNSKWSNLHLALYSIRDYIKYFFSCTSCARHFVTMSSDLESQLIHPNSSVLWLWEAHNKVNNRLMGEINEDPLHLKEQFPSKRLCPQCFDSSESYSHPHILQFLANKYKPESIVQDVGNQRMNDEVEMKIWSTNIFNGADYSLILLLYVISIGLIIILWIYLKRRKAQRKSPKHYYLPLNIA